MGCSGTFLYENVMSLKTVISPPPPIVVTLPRADQEASGAAYPGV